MCSISQCKQDHRIRITAQPSRGWLPSPSPCLKDGYSELAQENDNSSWGSLCISLTAGPGRSLMQWGRQGSPVGGGAHVRLSAHKSVERDLSCTHCPDRSTSGKTAVPRTSATSACCFSDAASATSACCFCLSDAASATSACCFYFCLLIRCHGCQLLF